VKLIKKVVRSEIRDLTRIKDTFDQRYEYLRLDKNERLLPFAKKDLNKFRKMVSSESLSGYGELGRLYRRLAKYLKVSEEQVFIASGSDLAIKSIYEACVEKEDNIVLHLPCYAMYRVYAKMFGADARGVSIRDDWSLNIDGMLRCVDDRTKFVCLENPNGFVGTKVDIKDVEKCASWLNKKDVILILDEAYCYVENTRSKAINLVKKYPNIVISQTFSKGHGLAGVRAGYLIGNPQLIGYISKVRPMHEVTSLTALAAEWVLNNPRMLLEFQKSIRQSKAYLEKELALLGIKYKNTHANFMLIYMPDEGRTKAMALRMRKEGILIRRPFEEPYLKGWSRVCVGSLKDSKVFIEVLKKLL